MKCRKNFFHGLRNESYKGYKLTDIPNLSHLEIPTKILEFTDIHWGCKNNSVQHNQDNLDYIDWVITIAKKEKPSHIAFLGDWFENRSAINILTLQYSYKGLKKLNELGIPVLFIIGNHDLYQRNTRDIHAADIFQELENFTVIDQPCSLGKDFLLLPFLFKSEYETIAPLFNSFKYVLGHLEFKNFYASGNNKLEHGPDHKLFNAPKYIFSGHYHQRQITDNVIYIGNTFPTNFGDAGDQERGACIFDVTSEKVSFENWPECPHYVKTNLSSVISGNWQPAPKTRVRCILDIDISYLEAQTLRDEFIKTFNLREFTIEESSEKQNALEGTLDEEMENDIDNLNLGSVDEMVISLLGTIEDMNSIDPKKLIEIYRSL